MHYIQLLYSYTILWNKITLAVLIRIHRKSHIAILLQGYKDYILHNICISISYTRDNTIMLLKCNQTRLYNIYLLLGSIGVL